MLVAVLLELNGVELATVITAERTELATVLSLRQCLDTLETLKCLILHRQELHPHVWSVIIDNEQKITLTTWSLWSDLSTEISVNQIQTLVA